MTGIAISYRREDTSGVTGRIFDRLRTHYASRANRETKEKPVVFLDYDSTPAGVDFRNYLKGVFENCDILLAIIGPNWMGDDGTGKPKIVRDDDWVRIEIEIALKKNIPLIPVLIDRTPMPSRDALPEEVRDLIYRQATVIDSQLDFNPHMERLIRQIDRVLGIQTREAKTSVGFADIPIEQPKREPTKRQAFGIATLVFVFSCISAITLWTLFRNPKNPPSPDQKKAHLDETLVNQKNPPSPNTYHSAELGITIIFPDVYFELNINHEKDERRLVLLTSQPRPLIQILRTALPDHKDVKVGREQEIKDLRNTGYDVGYWAPEDGKTWDNWYVVSGVGKGMEFYFKRWYFDDRVISFEFRYPKKCTPFFNKLIKPMTTIGIGIVPDTVTNSSNEVQAVAQATDDAKKQYAVAQGAEGDCFE
jgi:TIR domain